MTETLHTWIRDCSSLWSTPDLPHKIHITFSLRPRASLGRCSPRTGSIRLNPGLLDADPAILREVVCHEAAHVAACYMTIPAGFDCFVFEQELRTSKCEAEMDAACYKIEILGPLPG